MSIKLTIATILITFSLNLKAQLSNGGYPFFAKRTSIKTIEFNKVNQRRAIRLSANQGQKSNLRHTKELIYGINIDTLINLKNEKPIQIDKYNVWQLKIKSENAKSVGLLLNNFRVPPNAQLFVYNPSKTQILGAFNEVNNKHYNKLSISPIVGDELILEYSEPIKAKFSGEVNIKRIIHDFKGIYKQMIANTNCYFDINCYENSFVKNYLKRSVCHISISPQTSPYSWIGTGVVVNTVGDTQEPYVITAYHVLGEKNLTNAEYAMFYFNYETIECNKTIQNHPENSMYSISGSEILATGGHYDAEAEYKNTGLDFTLLKLSTSIPSSFNVYYAGWDSNDIAPNISYAIHHPKGYSKKISYSQQPCLSDQYIENKTYKFIENGHWRIPKWDLSTTSGGSSGSPLFNENYFLKGVLTGGDANCENPVNDFYCKFSKAWNYYNEENKQLKKWLDPESSGIKKIMGFNQNSDLNIELTNTEEDKICLNSNYNLSVNSNEIEIENNAEIRWFLGNENEVIPSESNDLSPSFKYTNSGYKKITVLITQNGKTYFGEKVIQVFGIPLAGFKYQFTKNNVEFSNLSKNSTNTIWDFGDNTTVNDNNDKIEHSYKKSGIFNIKQIVSNSCFSERDTTISINIKYNDNISIAKKKNSVATYIINFKNLKFETFQYAVYNSAGKKVSYTYEINSPDFIELDMSTYLPGLYILRVYINNNYISKKFIVY